MTPTLEEAKAYAVEIGLPEEEGENFWYYFDSQNWRKANGQKLAKWRSGLQTWKRNRRRYDAPQSRQDGSGRAGASRGYQEASRALLRAHRGNPEHVAFTKSTPEERDDFRVQLAKFEQAGGGSLHG